MKTPLLDLGLGKVKLFSYNHSFNEESQGYDTSLEYLEFDEVQERELKNPFDIDLVGCKHISFQYGTGRWGNRYSVRMNQFQDGDRKRFYSRNLKHKDHVTEEEFMKLAKELLETIENDEQVERSDFTDENCLELLSHTGLELDLA